MAADGHRQTQRECCAGLGEVTWPLSPLTRSACGGLRGRHTAAATQQQSERWLNKTAAVKKEVRFRGELNPQPCDLSPAAQPLSYELVRKISERKGLSAERPISTKNRIWHLPLCWTIRVFGAPNSKQTHSRVWKYTKPRDLSCACWLPTLTPGRSGHGPASVPGHQW